MSHIYDRRPVVVETTDQSIVVFGRAMAAAGEVLAQYSVDGVIDVMYGPEGFYQQNNTISMASVGSEAGLPVERHFGAIADPCNALDIWAEGSAGDVTVEARLTSGNRTADDYYLLQWRQQHDAPRQEIGLNPVTLDEAVVSLAHTVSRGAAPRLLSNLSDIEIGPGPNPNDVRIRDEDIPTVVGSVIREVGKQVVGRTLRPEPERSLSAVVRAHVPTDDLLPLSTRAQQESAGETQIVAGTRDRSRRLEGRFVLEVTPERRPEGDFDAAVMTCHVDVDQYVRRGTIVVPVRDRYRLQQTPDGLQVVHYRQEHDEPGPSVVLPHRPANPQDIVRLAALGMSLPPQPNKET